MSLRDHAARIDHAGEALTEAGARLAGVLPPADAFGAEVPGRLGELGGALHALAAAVLAARSREAAAHGARLSDAASMLQFVSASYAEVDESVRRRHAEHQGGQ